MKPQFVNNKKISIMKHLLSISLILLLTMTVQSQKKTFVRVFDEGGKKTHKGYLTGTTDSSVTILKNIKEFEIPIRKISVIKLRRSAGHTILVTSLVSGVALALFGIATADPDAWIFGYTAGEGAIAGLILGVLSGAGTGSLIATTRNRPVFKINMNSEQWMKTRNLLNSYLPVSENKK